ncbi:MAG: SAM-dependent DNA methyltransferase [Treponema sp.]|nr:SAM-dependent DNA methyltransferase [Treponema sp.]
MTNLILHDIEVPNVENGDSLNREYTSIGKSDRVDVILANPPFGRVFPTVLKQIIWHRFARPKMRTCSCF